MIPINPETSIRLKLINDQRMNIFDKEGLREIEINKLEKLRPTPTATPHKESPTTRPADKYLKPSNIILKNRE